MSCFLVHPAGEPWGEESSRCYSVKGFIAESAEEAYRTPKPLALEIGPPGLACLHVFCIRSTNADRTRPE